MVDIKELEEEKLKLRNRLREVDEELRTQRGGAYKITRLLMTDGIKIISSENQGDNYVFVEIEKAYKHSDLTTVTPRIFKETGYYLYGFNTISPKKYRTWWKLNV